MDSVLWNGFVYFISCILLARPPGVWYDKSERQGGQWCQRDRGLGWRPRPPPTQPNRRQVSRTRTGGWDTFGDAMRVPNLFQLWTRTLHCGVSVAIFATRAMSNHFSIDYSTGWFFLRAKSKQLLLYHKTRLLHKNVYPHNHHIGTFGLHMRTNHLTYLHAHRLCTKWALFSRTVPSSCYPAPSLEPIFGQYLGSGGSTDDQKMCVNEGWCPTFE